MAQITSTRRAYKDGLLTTDAECVRIELTTGEVLRFTNAFEDLIMNSENVDGTVIPLGSDVTYTATNSAPRPTAAGYSENQAGSMDIEGIFDPALFTRANIAAGKFNKARVTVFMTNYNIPIQDEEILFSGFWGEATAIDGRYVIKFSSLLDILNIDTGRVYNQFCDSQLGALRCGVKLAIDSFWQASTSYTGVATGDARIGSVVRVNDPGSLYYWMRALNDGTSGGSAPAIPVGEGTTVVDNDITWQAFRAYSVEGIQGLVTTSESLNLEVPLPDAEFIDYYKGGVVEILSGPNSGSRRRILSNTLSQLTLSEGFESDGDLFGDDIKIVVGCQKRLSEDCSARFNNHLNYQGFPYVPGETNVRQIGGNL